MLRHFFVFAPYHCSDQTHAVASRNQNAFSQLVLHQQLVDPHDRPTHQRRFQMLGWALTFLVVALIAGALGFGGIAGASAGIAKILFLIFIILFVVAMVARALRGRPPL
jgi:uncharacterized membrane protein YtjA (UPF0391 family)